MHLVLRAIYITFTTAGSLQPLQGMTADVRLRGGTPSALRARLDALVAAGGRCETFLFSGPAGTQQNQQQAETEQLHSHPAVRIKHWNDVEGSNLVIKDMSKQYTVVYD